MTEWLKDLWIRIKADLKKVHKSMTIQFNALMGLLAIALPYAQDGLPQIRDYIPTNVYGYLMIVLTVGNSILRFKTNCRLADK